MPEYFCVSLICKNPLSPTLINWFEKVGISKGENNIECFEGRKTLVYEIEGDEDDDFLEIGVAIPDFVFHKDKFYNEIKPLINFLNECFLKNQDLIYALCVYEINGYLLRNVKKLDDFDDKLLKQFPVVCFRDKKDGDCMQVNYNFEAQDLFSVF